MSDSDENPFEKIRLFQQERDRRSGFSPGPPLMTERQWQIASLAEQIEEIMSEATAKCIRAIRNSGASGVAIHITSCGAMEIEKVSLPMLDIEIEDKS